MSSITMFGNEADFYAEAEARLAEISLLGSKDIETGLRSFPVVMLR